MLPQAAAPGTRVPFPSVACPSGCSVGCDSFCPAPTAGDDTSQALRSKVSGSSPLGGCGPTHFYGSGLVFHRSGRCCPLARDVQAGAPDLGWEDSGPACASPAETPENSPLGPARNSGSPPPPPTPTQRVLRLEEEVACPCTHQACASPPLCGRRGPGLPARVRESVRGLWSRHTERKRQASTAPGRRGREHQANTHMSTARSARLRASPAQPCGGSAWPEEGVRPPGSAVITVPGGGRRGAQPPPGGRKGRMRVGHTSFGP